MTPHYHVSHVRCQVVSRDVEFFARCLRKAEHGGSKYVDIETNKIGQQEVEEGDITW